MSSVLIFSIVSGSILFVFPSPDMSAEDILVQRIAEMSVKLQHIDTLNDQRKLDLQSLSRDFTSFLKLVSEHQNQFENNNSSLNKKLAEYSKHGETEILIKTFSPLSIPVSWTLNLMKFFLVTTTKYFSGYLSGNFSQTFDLSLPSVETFLPNTLVSPNSFTPAFKISRNRAHVSIVLGKASNSFERVKQFP